MGVPWVDMKRVAWTERAAMRAAPKERAMATIVVVSRTMWMEMDWGWNGSAMDGREVEEDGRGEVFSGSEEGA